MPAKNTGGRSTGTIGTSRAPGQHSPLAQHKLLLQGANSAGMKSRISTAGTKYFAMSLVPPVVGAMNFRLIMPSRHLRFGSKTPDPEFPVVATSAISVE